MRKLLLSNTLLLCVLFADAQQFKYKATVNRPDSAGFYKIVLTPSFIAKAKADLSDVRLMHNKTQIPYIIKTETGYTENTFTEFPIIDRRREADSLTHVICRNTNVQQVNELFITIGNTEANRSVSISGSNDSLRWYIIKENVPIERNFGQNTQFIQAITLPATSYRFYNISIDGKNLVPVDILKAGIRTAEARRGAQTMLARPAITVGNSGNRSQVDIAFNDTYHIDEINVNISAPRYFSRNVRVLAGDSTAELLGYYNLSSEKPAPVPLNYKSNRLHLQIENGDNPPLTIDSITAFQYNKYVIAYMEAGNTYELFTGDSSLNAPVYDLSTFADKIGKDVKTLAVSDTETITGVLQPKREQGTMLIWITIAIALVVLLIITFRMLNEVKKR